MNNILLISVVLTASLGGLYIYNTLKRKEEGEPVVPEVEKGKVKEVFDKYYEALRIDRFKNYWCNNIRFEFSVLEINETYKSQVEYKNSLKDFHFSMEEQQFAKEYIAKKVNAITEAPVSDSTVDQLIFLYSYTQYIAEQEALLKAQDDFNIKSKDENYYNELVDAHSDRLKNIISSITISN